MFIKELFEKEKKKTDILENKVFHTLRNAILTGYLYPGEKLIEEEIAKMIGVSRTPIRAAILRLKKDKLLVSEPQKGSRVAKLSPKEIEEGYIVMGGLQGFAAHIGLKNINDKMISKMMQLQGKMKSKDFLEKYSQWLKINNQFHDIFIDACQNSSLIRIIRENLVGRTRYWYLACSFGFLKKSIGYHDQIIQNIKHKDATSLRKTVEAHFFETGKDVRNYLESIMI